MSTAVATSRGPGSRAPRIGRWAQAWVGVIAILALLATYPGWMYWAGLPYSYAAIVPLSLLCMVLLWRVETLIGWHQALLAGRQSGCQHDGALILLGLFEGGEDFWGHGRSSRGGVCSIIDVRSVFRQTP